MAEFKDTPEQALAKTTDRHLSLTANAGSGKTTVLVDRFMNIILNKDKAVEPKKVTAITFTKMAATEMTERMVKRLNGLIEKTDDTMELKRLMEIRSKLSSARISTIHSFCGALLRDFPIEAEVAPNFKELTGADLMIILNQAAFDTIEKRLFENKIIDTDTPEILTQKKEDTETIIKAFGGKNKLEEILRVILQNRKLFAKIKELYAQDISELRKLRDKEISDSFIKQLENFVYCYNMADQYFTPESMKPKDYNKVSDLRRIVSDFFAKVNLEIVKSTTGYLNWESINSLSAEFKEISLKLFTKSGDYSAPIGRALLDVIIKTELATIYQGMKNISELFEAEIYDEEQVRLSRILIGLGEEAIQIYSNDKEEVDGLDFEDLIEKVDLLLDRDDVRRKLNRKIEYLLVDEFQDTDDVQYSIVKKIIQDLNEPNENYKNNLFIVGDPKQSIYGFRNADVRVFEKAKEEIKKANSKRESNDDISKNFNTSNGEIISPNDETTLGKMKLSSTFRLKPEVGNFVNYVCSNLFGDKNSEFDVDYDELVCAKGVEFLSSPLPHSKGEIGEVNFIVAIKPYNDKKKDNESANPNFEPAYKTEEDLICDFIIKTVNEGNAKFEDFGILSRAAKPLDDLTVKLIERGIPFVNHSGGGFFAIPEVRDLIALMRFIINSSDDIALLSVLKSSMCGFTNTDLYVLSNIEANAPYFERLAKLANSEFDNPESQIMVRKAKRCFAVLAELNKYRLDLPPTLLLIKAFEKFNWFYVIKDSPFADKIKANVDKFMAMARSYFHRGFKNVYDFVEELNYYEQHELKEAEAAQISSENVVNLMTIHASKGLEFKNVILYKTAKATRIGAGQWFSMNEKMGLNFKFNVDTPDGYSISDAKSTFHFTADAMQKEKDAAEEKRILYVAMTRAEESLTIACTLIENKPDDNKKDAQFRSIKNTLLGNISRGLEYNYEDLVLDDQIRRPACWLPILRNIEGNFVQDKIMYNLDATIYRSFGDIGDIIPSKMDSDGTNIYHESILLPQILNGTIEGEFISASRLMKFIEHRNDYAKKYILGLPESDPTADIEYELDKDSNDSGDEESDEIISAANLGTAIHYVFEHINKWMIDVDVYDSELQKIIAVSLENYHFNSGEYPNLLFKICSSVAQSQLIQRRLPQLQTSQAEYSLYFCIGNDFIQGIIDLLIENEDGEYEVWDWKSNVINDNLYEKAKSYEIQMKLYAYFVYRVSPFQKKYTSKLLFVRQSEKAVSDKDWTYNYSWTAEELQRYEIELVSIIKSVKNYPFLDFGGRT